ncbi:tyrosine-protein phosphatase Lar isoform X3 [Trichogramma pretiosum]|uniref:tyrosine-protein phosphatase Lar isoform X3 n=1 Tax=Trichogramma pretiosum TaxID=7493 RepID=UPI000C71AC2A|nr:tyrosine-protein phosphatase Lar isoform X3 [Trichogramma pretiosum]
MISMSIMTPIFLLVLLLVIDPLTAQSSGERGPPRFLGKPQSLKVKAGGIASFFCSASGSPPPQIHWRKNGRKITQTQSRFMVHPYDNGTLLRIEPVRTGRDSIEYECLAENGVGDAVTATATLTVHEAERLPQGFPMITQAPTTKVVEKGHNALLSCAAVGSPTPIISWMKNMLPIDTTNPRYTVLETGSLQITESEPSDQGKYECVANNTVGTEYSKSTMLYVKMRRVAPQFSIPPNPVNEVMLGSSLNLTCVAVGAPMPYVKWRKEPATDLTPDNLMPPVGKNVLQLKDIKESANYTCIAQSELGIINATTLVKVHSLPLAPEHVQVSDVTAMSVKLTWSYKGPDQLAYYVIQHKPRHANQAFAEISGITTMYYQVRTLSPYTEYEFYVIAVNDIGRGPPSAPVVVTTGETSARPGSAPRNVQVRPLSSTTMVIQWDEPETPNGQVTGYKVYYTTDPSQPMPNWQFQTVDNNQLTTISDLTAHVIYTIRVQALTSIGPGPLSTPVQIKTQQGVPSQPENLQAVDIGETSVTLKWNKPAHSADNILSYELYWNDTYAQEKHHRKILELDTYTLTGLYPNTLYYIWLAARSQRGEGATTIPLPVRTKEYVPGAPPRNVTGYSQSATSILVKWEPPPIERSNGPITYYKLYYVEKGISDSGSTFVKQSKTEYLLEELKKWTEYRIWVVAGTSVGDGPPSYPITVRTQEDVPGDPQNVKATAINSTTIHVEWEPPKPYDRNGIIRGYHVYVQEVREESQTQLNEPILSIILEEKVLQTNISGLQPDTRYDVQVAALTRKGDGARSLPAHVKTPGGVPGKPQLTVKVMSREDPIEIEVEWKKPQETFGKILGYRIRYGVKNQTLKEINIEGDQRFSYRITDLEERGVDYEFRVAGRNAMGYGQEQVRNWFSQESAPSGAPINLNYNFQTPDTVCITWEPPPPKFRNGHIVSYNVQFHKKIDHTSEVTRNTTKTRAVFIELEENTEYVFHVKALTLRGGGPYSEKLFITTDKDIGRAPMSVNAVATSESSAEVWWDPVPNLSKIVGYQIFYTTTAVEDLDEWKNKSVGLTESADLLNLEKYATYAVAVAARYKTNLGRLSVKTTVKVWPEDVPLQLRAPEVSTHSMVLSWTTPLKLNPINYKISFDAVKEFVDSQGMTQTQIVPRRTILLDANTLSTEVKDLQPFTTYNVNVSAVPPDQKYRPPSKITVTTQMAAPKPMVGPAFYGVVNGEEIQVILPQASEEYGPISHYYLIVVPESLETANKQPDEFTQDQLVGKNSKDNNPNKPYVTAKFPHRDIPYTFHLGDDGTYEGFLNAKLDKMKRYRIFVRAIVDTPRKHLYTSSPFSEYLSLDMREPPPGEPPRRPHPDSPIDGNPEVSVDRSGQEPGMVWVVGPIIAALMVSVCLVLLFVIKKRRQPCKAPDQTAVTRPLMSADINTNHAPSDPVEMRRLNFQTPGMISHPPIPISELSNHIDRLKANDNLKFSQEYESIEPGQQFTWDHSNMEVNTSKNRYANVIAYDHSRVILQTVDGIPGSDYINANYCDGYRKQNAYVATQGPLADTFGDFWRMCWEVRSSTIVMMTKLEERTRIKCDQYWPTRGTETYGQMQVTIGDVQELATYCIRTFQVCRHGYSERREIKQLQFTAWPDHGVPEHPAPFLQFLRRVRILNPSDAGPLIVHCSAGVGRTGCFIVIDSMLERIKHEKTIDIYGHVTCLRAQRNYMVQTEDQYVFIHDALLEAVICGNTEVPARNLHSHMAKLMQLEIDNITGMELEFKKLSNIKVDSTRFISANLPCNKHKNRLVHILPYECTRVCLQPQRNIEGSDYINASLIDGYRYRSAYIATQGPLNDTTDDFWRMLWEHNSTIVVMLTKLKEMGREKCHQYWPSDRSIRYQCFVVDPIAEYNMPQYILREFKVTDARDGSSRTVRQFQFIDWPEQGVPKAVDGFIDFIGQVHKTKEQFGQDGPITVHCSAGVGRTGVFITLSIVLERMQYEGVVDIFQTVRILRTQRPAMVQTEDQYQFCYRASLDYLGSFDHYTN